MPNPNALGKFVWYELMSSDPKKATDFYSKVFGWNMENMDVGMPYTVFSSKKGQIGGIMGKPEGVPAEVPSHWIPYVYVPDLEAAADKVKRLGGSVMVGPKDVPDMGRFVIITDPQGAVMALWESKTDVEREETMPGDGDISWHELMTKDYKAALTFYSALFGWQAAEAHDMGEAGTYQTYKRGDNAIGGMFNAPAPNARPGWMLYVRVPDVNKTIDAVKANGGQLVHGPMEVPGGAMIANFTDPTGAGFAALQPPAQM